MAERNLKPMILGEAPGPSGGTGDPLGRHTAKRLCGFAGWDPEPEAEDPYRAALAKRFELRNLLDRPTGRSPRGKGMLWPVQEARTAATRLDLEGRAVIALGRRVGAAVGAPKDYFRVVARETGAIALIPHPSGIVRNWNNPAVCEAAGRVLRMFAAES